MLSTLTLWPSLLQRLLGRVAALATPAAGVRRHPSLALPLARTPGITLPVLQARTLRLRQGDVVLVREGRLWLTRTGDSQDHFLQSGTCFVASRTEAVVVESFGLAGAIYEVERAARRLGA
jgi:hypothetical protein